MRVPCSRPAPRSLRQALNTLTPGQITEVKNLKTPPVVVTRVLEAVCVLKGETEQRPLPWLTRRCT